MEYKYKKDLDKNIFRGYDIRGVYPTNIDEDTAYTFGLGFGTHIQRIGKKKCVVGHDNRLSSPSLYEAVIKGILDTGVDVVRLGLCTTPMYYYACIKMEIPSGAMITASHNPKDDNGIKFAFDEKGNCKGQEIQDFLAEILEGNFIKGEGSISDYDIEPEYIELYKSNLHFGDRKLKVVLDPANGTTSDFCRKIYELFPMDLTIINEESDGNFPNHHPDPCVESNLEQLKAKVLEEHADIGISFDGDGDRLGVVSPKGEFIPTDIYMIVIVRDIINKVNKKEFLCDVKCSKTFTDAVEAIGGKIVTYRTGNSYTRMASAKGDYPLSGELSGHVYFRDKWPGYDDGIYAGMRLIEMLSNTDRPLSSYLENLEHYYSTPEIKVQVDDAKKFMIVDKIKNYCDSKNYNYITIDGVKVKFSDGFALVRASNTGPNITMRFESKDENKLNMIQKEFTNELEKYLN